MATLNYRDPTSGAWVAVPVYAGPAGPPGPAGPTGVAAVSATGGNTAVLGTDGQIFVPAGGLDPATATARYVDVPGDAMTGELLVPDQVATNPTDPLTAAARGYVDQVVTVAATGPTLPPVREGQAWFVVEDVVAVPPPIAPTTFTGVWTDATTNTISWIDSTVVTTFATDTSATYEIRYNTTGAVVGDADALVATGIAAGIQTAVHTKGSAEQIAQMITYGIKAVNPSGSSAWVPMDVARPNTNMITLTYPTVAAAGFSVAGAFTVDWGDGSPLESYNSNLTVSHNYSALHGPVVVAAQAGNDLTKFSLTTSATSPTEIVFDAVTLTDISFNSNTKQLERVDFLSPVVLDTCASKFEDQQELVSVTGSIASTSPLFTSMFSRCGKLVTLPALDTSNGIEFSAMFGLCQQLTAVPALDCRLGTNFNGMFSNVVLLNSVLMYGARYDISVAGTRLDTAALDTFFTNLGTADNTTAPQTVSIANTVGAATCDRTIATAKNWTVTG